MDYDSYSCLVEFDADYWNLVERAFAVAKSTEAALPQTGSRQTAQHFRSKFEEMEKQFRDEFISVSRPPATKDANDGCNSQLVKVI